MRIPATGINPWKFNSDGYIYRADGYVGIATDAPTERLHVSGFIRANDPILPVHVATKAYVDNQLGVGPVATTESFTIFVNGTSGSNPSPAPILNTQVEANLYLFKTIAAAVNAIPAHVLHPVKISVADGTYTMLTPNIFGDLSRFTFGWSNPIDITNGSGRIEIISTSGLQILSGTAQMTVSTATNDHDFTVSPDPGFALDAYQGYYIRVASGAGIGQIKAIYTNSGANFKVAGRFSPNVNATSVVEIVGSRVIINIDALTRETWFFQQSHGTLASLDNMPFSLENITIERTATNLSIFLVGGGIRFVNGFRGLRIAINAENSLLSLDNAVFDGKGVGSSTGILRLSGGYIRSRSSDSSWLVRGGTAAGIRLSPQGLFGFKSEAFLFKGRIENCVTGVEVIGNSFLTTSTALLGTTNSGYGVTIKETSRYQPDLADMADAEHLTGALGDVQLDDAHVITYTDIDNSPDNIIIGQEYSVVKGI